MQQVMITDNDISRAERILLPSGEHFDEERTSFIKNLETIDLQAVPGSGKTTVLLAKLLALENQLPLKDGSGVLVISHTNTAVNEIRNKIGKYCPKLFSYPNFVGTIQSFVDEFLSRPFYLNRFKAKPHSIDRDIYIEGLEKRFSWSIKGFTKKEEASARYYLLGKNCKHTFRLGLRDGIITLLTDIDGTELKIAKPKRGNNWCDFSDTEKDRIRTWLIKYKIRLIKAGILDFDDAYFLAQMCLHKYPIYKKLIRKRFRYVFVDEMQDMEKHQYDLLESVFYCDDVIYQRIGDKNQAIYSRSMSFESIWEDRVPRLSLTGSYRLSSEVAKVVNNFALDSSFQAVGQGDSENAPCMIVFSDDCIHKVLPKFTELVREKIPKNIIEHSKYPIKCIGWRKEGSGNGNFGIKSYYGGFEPSVSTAKVVHPTLKSHLTLWKAYPGQTNLLNAARKSILEALIAILRKEGIAQSNDRYFNISSLFQYLCDQHKDYYEHLKSELLVWSIDVFKGNIESVHKDIQGFVPSLLNLFGKEINKSVSFINGDDVAELSEGSMALVSAKANVYSCSITGLEVEIGTVHSSKGETHLASLYLETYYQGKHDSDWLAKCFCGQGALSKKFEKEAAKIAYVAMSRPSHLLCIAIHRNRFNAIKDKISGWDIKDLASKAVLLTND